MAGADTPWSVQLLSGHQYLLAAVDQVIDALGLATGQLDRSDFQAAGAAGNLDAVPIPVQHGAGGVAAALLQGCGLVDADALLAQIGKGAGPGVKGTNQAFDLDGAAGPVDVAFFLGQFVGVVGVGVVLRLGGQFAVCQLRQGFNNGTAAHVRQAVVQAAAGVVGVDRGAGFQQHIAGIQAFVHLHDGDAGFRIAGGNGPLDRGGTAPARQQGGVDVQAAVGRDVQNGFRQDQAVSGYDHHVRFQG